MRFTTPTYYAPEDEGGAAVETPPVEAAPVVEEAAPVVEGEGAPVEEAEPVVVDWGAKVTEWGGEDTVSQALQLREALSTREGVTELFRQAAAVIGPEAARELLGIPAAAPASEPPAGEAEPTIEELLSDPERVLTAGEVQRLLQHEEQQRQQRQQQQTQAQVILSTIESTLADLKIEDEDDRKTILGIADGLVPPEQYGDPAAVAAGIRKAHDSWQAKVTAAAEAIVKNRAAVHEALPAPLPAGGTGGTGSAEGEPQTLEEAKKRAREQLGISS